MELSKIASANFWDISLIFAAIFFIIPTILFSLFMIIEIPLIITLLINKRAKNLIRKYFPARKKYEKNILDFTELYPKNKKLAELKKGYKNRVETKIKKLKKNLIVSGLVFGIMLIITVATLIGIMNKPYISEKSNGTVLIHSYKTTIENNFDSLNVFTNNFYFNFNKAKDELYIIKLNHIVLKTSNKLNADSIDSYVFPLQTVQG